MTKVPKLEIDGSIATFNYQTRRWESDDTELAEQLQKLLYLSRSPNDCMQYYVANWDATVLEWGDESYPEEHPLPPPIDAAAQALPSAISLSPEPSPDRNAHG